MRAHGDAQRVHARLGARISLLRDGFHNRGRGKPKLTNSLAQLAHVPRTHRGAEPAGVGGGDASTHVWSRPVADGAPRACNRAQACTQLLELGAVNSEGVRRALPVRREIRQEVFVREIVSDEIGEIHFGFVPHGSG